MNNKLVSKILWHGNDVDSEGNPIYPPASSDKDHLDGLNRGEIYIQDNDNSPQIVIRTDKGNIKPIISGGGGEENPDIDIIKLNDSRQLTDENVLSSLRSLYEIQSRIIKEEDLDTVLRDNNVFSSLRTLYEIRSRIIKKNDTTTQGTNDNTFSSLRIIKEIEGAISTLKDIYLSKEHDDIAKGHITFEQGIYVKGGNKENEQPILEEGNSIYEDTNGIIEESLPAPAPLTSTLGGLDNVDDTVDVPSNKDVILIKKAGSSEWTQEDKTISDTILEAPKDGKQYARQDGEWSEVKATSVDVPTKLSQLENDADYVQDPNYIHTDNNFSTLLKGQLSDLSTEYLNAANKLNYQRAKTFFSKTHADTSSVWGFVRYFNNLPTLTGTQVRITGVRSDFNGDQISDSYVNLSGATHTLAGIMTAADKTKLDGIATGATKVIVDSTMSETSLNPVQNKIITSRFIQVEGMATNLETQYSALSNTLSPISVAWNKRGTKDGFLILGENGIISSQYLPSYVDDVVEVYATYDKSATGVLSNIKLYTNSTHTTAVVPESGKIYIDITAGKPPYQFRWSGTTYIDLNTGGLILGTIAGTAFEGNKGNVLYTNFGEGVNLTGTQKARNFFKVVGDAEPYLRGIGIGTYSDTGLNVNYEIGYFDGTKDSDHFNIKAATKTQAGLMSAPDKTKLDNLVSFELPSAIIYNIKAFQAESYVNVIYDFMYADGTPDSDSFTIDAATSTQAGVITATDKIKLDNAVTLNTNQTITGVKHIKNDLYIDAIDSDKKIIFNNGNIRMLPYASGGSAQGLYFCNPSNEILGVLGSYSQDNYLNYLYIGTGYEDSKNWITFTPNLTTIKTYITSLTGILRISDGGGIGKGIQTSIGNGLVTYDGTTATYLSQSLGTTYIRSGDNNLYHRRTATDYTILDLFNTPNPFCYRGSASVDHVDLASTNTSAGATGFVNYNSGTYMVSRGGSTAMYIKFQGAGSTSGLELYTNYLDGSPLQFRKIVDNNRISGVWSTILDQKNWAHFITFDKLSDKPLISVDATPNSLVKRNTNGFILGGNAGITFTDTSKNSDTKNAWVISTNTSYGGTSYDLKISQYIVGTKGNLLLNGVPVATTGNRYIMTLYLINASGLDENTYYPVTIPLFSGGNFRIEVLTSLNGIVPSWSTHASGFTVRFIEEVQGNGWGATPIRRRIIDSVSSYVRDVYPPIGKVTQMTNSSTEVIWVRGGGLYYFYTSGTGSNLITPVLRTTSYTANSQTVSPIPVADKDNSIVRNVVMNDDAVYEPTASTIVRRDPNGYINGVRFYTTTPVEDYGITHVAFFYNSDGYIRKTPLSGLNRQLRFDKLLNIIAGSNEFNILPSTYSKSTLWLNYSSFTYGSTSYEDTASTIDWVYIGNGQRGKAYVSAKGFERAGSTDRYALTGAGGHMIITQDITPNSLAQRDSGGNMTAKAYYFAGSNSKVASNCIELYSPETPYIDFHYQNSTADYTSRIIERQAGELNFYAPVKAGFTGQVFSNVGFVKLNSSDSYMLLGGGSHKLLSDFVDRTSDQFISGIKNFYTTKVDGNYANRAIILRETNMGQDSNKSNLYAPSIGFHWGRVNQSIISIHTDGNFHFTYTTTEGNYRSLYCNGIVKSGSSSDYALVGNGGHLQISENTSSNTLVKRTGIGHINLNDLLANNYILHTSDTNPYLRFIVGGSNYYAQATSNGISIGPTEPNSFIVNAAGNAGLGIMPNNAYKLAVNGNIRVSNNGTINAGENVDMGYGYINVDRPNTIENATCFSMVKNGDMAFGLGFNSSNQIVLGQGKTDKTLIPWLKIGASSSTFEQHLNTQTTSTEYGEFNHDLGRMLSTVSALTGTICITLPVGWINSMNMYEIYVYEYNSTSGSKILVSGYNYGATPTWVNYKYISEGNYDKKVRLGYRGGKCCILLGETTSVWAYPQIFLANVYNGYSGLGSWKNGYTIGIITSESDVTNIVTVARSYTRSVGFVKDGSSNSYVLLGGGDHLAYSESATSNSLVKRSGNGYIFGKFFNSDNPVQDNLTVTNLFFETGSDGYHRKASLGHVTDTMRVATQTLKGLMSAEDKKKVDLFDPTKFLRRDIDDDALGHITFHKGIYVDGGSYDGQSIMEADGVNGIMEADGVNGIMEYSAPAPVAVSMTLGELTNVSSSVNTAASSKVMFVKGAGESVWTQETIIPNALYGFTDTRNVATTPNDYNKSFKVVGLKTNSAIGNSLTANTYSYLIGYRGWSDYSGGNSHEISFNDDGIYHRTGTTTSWNSWTKFLTSSNWRSYITIPTALKNPNAITFTGAVTGTYDGSAAKTVNIPTMPDLGPYALKDFSNVTIQSLGQNGYCKFPNGLLIQWGVNSTGTAAQRTVSLPISFYDSSYVVTATVFTSSSEITQAVSVTAVILSKSTSSFIGCTRYVGTSSNAGYSTWGFNWTAIGRWK